MYDSTERELKVWVERSVRPVRTSRLHKDRMRRELLAHATEAFAEERTRAGSDEEALDRTLTRLGAPDQLSAELQTSCRLVDQSLFRPLSRWDRFGKRRPHETALQFDTRMTLTAMLVFPLFTSMLFFTLGVTKNWQFPSPNAVPGFFVFVGLAVVAMPMAVAIHHARRASLRQRTPLRSTGLVLLASAFAAGVTITGAAVVNWTAGATLVSPDPYAFVTAVLVGTITFEASARLSLRDLKRFEEWESLQID